MLQMPSPMLMVGRATPIPYGQVLFTASASYVVPSDVTEISAVVIGFGGLFYADFQWAGAGGGLAYRNAIPTTPGETLTITVEFAGQIAISRGTTQLCAASSADRSSPGGPLVGTGFSGGFRSGVDGGGAAGYTTNGGNGAGTDLRGGGGTSPYGGGSGAPGGGQPGGSPNENGQNFGGGAGANGSPGAACVRIIFGGGRAFPNTNTGDM